MGHIGPISGPAVPRITGGQSRAGRRRNRDQDRQRKQQSFREVKGFLEMHQSCPWLGASVSDREPWLVFIVIFECRKVPLICTIYRNDYNTYLRDMALKNGL